MTTILALKRLNFAYVLFIIVTILPFCTWAANYVKLAPIELARAINAAGAGAVPYRKVKISPSEIRIARCVGPDEEPTEFECTWRQRTTHGWVTRKTWLAIDGRGWHVID